MRLSLLGRFTVMGLLVVAALGVAIALVLKRQIEREELVLHDQPKVALPSGEVTGVEALVRWQHPARGLLPPAEFVPLAERTGRVADLTRWVLDRALAQCRAWRDDGLDVPVAVNLAAANIVDVALPGAVAELRCDTAQGYHVSRPLPAERLAAWLRDQAVSVSLRGPARNPSSSSASS